MAGGGSSFFAADPAQVAAGGTVLRDEAAGVGAARAYGGLSGLVEGVAVEGAAAGFRGQWAGALDRWQVSLASLGEATEASGWAIAQSDAQAAGAWASVGAVMGP